MTEAKQTTVTSTHSKAATLAPARLPYHPALEERFGVGQAEWRALIDAIFPLAKEPESIILALSYCRARKLDPFKRVVHIVPMWNAALGRMVETVWPGIGELRTTAFRTRQYAGRDNAEFGPTVTKQIGNAVIEFPEWCQITAYRVLDGQKYPFPGPRVYWVESYATTKKDDPTPNSMWRKRPFGQLDKCAEAAALRAAFPEEIGNDHIADEMEGKTLGVEPSRPAAAPRATLNEKLDAVAEKSAHYATKDPPHDPETGEVLSKEENEFVEGALAGAKAEEPKVASAAEDAPWPPEDTVLGLKRLIEDGREKAREGPIKLKYWIARLNKEHHDMLSPYLDRLRKEADEARAVG